MVSKQADQRQTVKNAKAKNTDAVAESVTQETKKMPWWLMLLGLATGFVAALCIGMLASSWRVSKVEEELVIGECPSLGGEIVNSDECVVDIPVAKRFDFQGLVDEWVSSVGGKKGVIIYDLMGGEVVGEFDADKKFETASIYKLFVVYAGYIKVDRGEWAIDDLAGKTGYTIGECLDLAIRESNSECAETLWNLMGRNELDVVVQNEFGLPDVVVGSLMATPREVMQMMRKYYAHIEIGDDKLASSMLDSFLNQPITTYNWRQGLPSGFSSDVLVYNKVGWEYAPDEHSWLIYNDAAVVDFPDADRTFVIVVMTNGVDFSDVARFAGNFEQSFRQQL